MFRTDTAGYARRMFLRVRLWLYRALPFLERWGEYAPACCGTCPTFLGATATGASITWLGAKRWSLDELKEFAFGGTSRFPQTPSTGPLRGRDATRPE